MNQYAGSVPHPNRRETGNTPTLTVQEIIDQLQKFSPDSPAGIVMDHYGAVMAIDSVTQDEFGMPIIKIDSTWGNLYDEEVFIHD